MRTQSLLTDLKTVFWPVTAALAVVLMSMAFGKIVTLWFFDEKKYGTWGLLIMAIVDGLLILWLSGLVHESSPDAHTQGPKQSVTLFQKFRLVLLALGILVAVEVLSAVIDQVVAPWLQQVNMAIWLAIFFLVLFYFLSLVSFRYNANFRRIFFNKDVPAEQGTAKFKKNKNGMGLIIPLSTPRSLTERDLPFCKKPLHRQKPVLDIENLLGCLDGKSLSDVCADLRQLKQDHSKAAPAVIGSQKCLNEEDLANLSNFNWTTLLVLLDWLQQQGQQPKIHFLGSDDGKGAIQNSQPFLEHAQRLVERFGMQSEVSSVDFDDIDEVYAAINQVIEAPGWQNLNAVIDVTGGTKPVSIAGGAVSAHKKNCRIVYVKTNDLLVDVWNPVSRDSATNLRP